MTLQVQFTTIIYMILGGIYLGIALETFRRFSSIWQHHKFLVYCLEICFWLMQTVILFYILYLANHGELRFYIFISGLLGFSMYQAIFRTLYQKLLEHLIYFSLQFYYFCKRVIQILIISPINWVLTMIFIVANFILLLVFNILKIIFLPIKWIGKFIYFLLPKKIQEIVSKTPQLYSIIKNTWFKWVKYIMRR